MDDPWASVGLIVYMINRPISMITLTICWRWWYSVCTMMKSSVLLLQLPQHSLYNFLIVYSKLLPYSDSEHSESVFQQQTCTNTMHIITNFMHVNSCYYMDPGRDSRGVPTKLAHSSVVLVKYSNEADIGTTGSKWGNSDKNVMYWPNYNGIFEKH